MRRLHCGDDELNIPCFVPVKYQGNHYVLLARLSKLEALDLLHLPHWCSTTYSDLQLPELVYSIEFKGCRRRV